MIKSLSLFPLLIALSFTAQAATPAGDSANGKKLLDAHCASCHNDSVYKRPDHKVKSLEGLEKQVTGCGHAAGVSLEKTQVSDLVKYLNDTYYKFK
jgi:hypothetical protein